MKSDINIPAGEPLPPERRDFLRAVFFGVNLLGVGACGGGSTAIVTTPQPTPVTTPAPDPSPVPSPSPEPGPAPAPALPPSPAPAPPPAVSGRMRFSVSSGNAGTWPFCVGFAFRQGDLPQGRSAIASPAASQCTVKNRWPDGSIKFAVVAGTVLVASGVPTVVTITSAPASEQGKPLSTADLRSTNISVKVVAGPLGTASWAESDWDAPFLEWVAGPQMSSWIYRKRVGTDATLVAWLEVRLFADGAVEVLPWIENGFIRVAGATNKLASFGFELGGRMRFSQSIDLPHHCRTPLVSGSALSHWLDTDPALVVKHDAEYLQSTRLVPTYRANTPETADSLAHLPSDYTPLQLGNYTDAMGATGYQPAIGLLPEWDVLHLTAKAIHTGAAVIRNAYSAGRWGIHYRDENTNRPLRFSQYPTLSVNSSTVNDFPAAGTGTAPGSWDVSHHPSVGYMAYLISGRWYCMEQVQFAATYNYLVNVDGGPYANRHGSDGRFLSNAGANTVRGAAWAVRTLAQAASITPDGDNELRAEFIASLEANIAYNHATYVAQSNNPFGIVVPYGDAYGTPADGKVTEAAWQQDFYTAAFGYTLAMNPSVSAASKAKLSEFFAWKARSVVGRFGTASPSDWLYRDAAVYNFVVAFVDEPDWAGGTGPWPVNWGAMYAASVGPDIERVEGGLRGGNFPYATSYWGNLQPALAYSVDHGVSGAATAYLRMTAAVNWETLMRNFNIDPVWSVRPIA